MSRFRQPVQSGGVRKGFTSNPFPDSTLTYVQNNYGFGVISYIWIFYFCPILKAKCSLVCGHDEKRWWNIVQVVLHKIVSKLCIKYSVNTVVTCSFRGTAPFPHPFRKFFKESVQIVILFFPFSFVFSHLYSNRRSLFT